VGDQDPFFINFPEFAQFRAQINRIRANNAGRRLLKASAGSASAATVNGAAEGGGSAPIV
jgi:hypothetical protein